MYIYECPNCHNPEAEFEAQMYGEVYLDRKGNFQETSLEFMTEGGEVSMTCTLCGYTADVDEFLIEEK